MRQRLYNLIVYILDILVPPKVVYKVQECHIEYYPQPRAREKGKSKAA